MVMNFYVQDTHQLIGKSPDGWCFLVHIYPEEGINTLDDWLKILKEKTIVNEYGDKVSFEQLRDIITVRNGPQEKILPKYYDSWQEFHMINHSIDGPNNLFRCQADENTTHGEGTYDYVNHEFS
jgi:hypothetical protein